MSRVRQESLPVRNRIRSIIGGLYRRPMVRDKDRFLKVAHQSCQETQQQTLARILSLNADSRFSQQHGLRPDLRPEEFRKRFPVSDYERFRDAVDQMTTGDHRALLGSGNRLLMFATTSGTTAAPKLIPVTDQFLRAYRTGWQRWGIATHQAHPGLNRLRLVQMASNHEQYRTADGTPCGNISGLVTSMQKLIVRKLYVVPAVAAGITNSLSRHYTALRFALAEPWVGMFITANPATLLRMTEVADRHAESLVRDIRDGRLSAPDVPKSVAHSLRGHLQSRPKRARRLESIFSEDGTFTAHKVWPQLACLGVWSGGSAGAFRRSLQERFGDLPIRDHGLHASEGRMTIPFEDNTPSGILDIETHYFEFLPTQEVDSASPVTLEAHELQQGHEYYILLTTCSGLYRYNIRDVVQCTGFHGSTPLLRFLHKGSSMSSITGEKLSESQVIDSVRAADRSNGVTQFTLTPSWGSPPGYRLYVRTSNRGCPHLSSIAKMVEAELVARNCEYLDKRESGRLAPVECVSMPTENWERFRHNRLKVSGGSEEQYKHPCLLPDPEFERLFERLTESASSD